MVKYPYLLFDADDTLLDFKRNGWKAFSMLCAKYHFPCNREIYQVYEDFNQPLWRQTERGLISKDFLKVERFRLLLDYLHRSDDPEAVSRDYLAFMGTGSFLMPYAEEVCRQLSKNHNLYILTNSVESVHIDRMRQSLIAPYIKDSFISEAIGHEKPSKFYFDYVFDHVPGLTRENCLLIGDSLTSDIQGANNYGIPCVWFDPDGAPLPQGYHAEHIIRALHELYAILGD